MRKTFHHLGVGDHVVIELFWDGMVSLPQYMGKVVEVGQQRLKIRLPEHIEPNRPVAFSRQGGQAWGASGDLCWRIAPAHARVKGAPPKPYTPPKGLLAWGAGLPAWGEILRQKHFEHPGQPLVCAAAIVAIFPSPEAAAVHQFCTAEEEGDGPASKVVAVLLAYRQHKSIDRVITELHAGWRWRDTAPMAPVEPADGLGKQAATVLRDAVFAQGQAKAEALEPMLRTALAVWFGRRS